MNNSFKLKVLFSMNFVIFFCVSCTKDPPTVSTNSVTEITTTTAVSGGNVIDNGGEEVTSRGVCWGTAENPDIKSLKTIDGAGNGTFISNINDLTENTVYHVRAYATNSVGTSYGDDISFKTISNTLQDIDYNIYNTVQIGSQLWMKENLRTTKYNDGSNIPNITDSQWNTITSGAFCWYDNNVTNKDIYGALYNWFAVSTGKLCPTGWHLPSNAELTALETYLVAGGFNYDGTTSGNKIAKSLSSVTLWTASATPGAVGNPDYPSFRNKTGFSAVPGGHRDARYSGGYGDIGSYGTWWSTTEDGSNGVWCRTISYDKVSFDSYSNYRNDGFSVRCLKDN